MRSKCLLLVLLVACTPSSVADAEKSGNVAWLEKNGSADAVAALGRLADEDKSAQAALERTAQRTENGKSTDGGASALDVYIAVWNAVERKQPWAQSVMKTALADKGRMEDAASAMKRGSPKLDEFVPDLDAAMGRGCKRCAPVLASGSGSPARAAMARHLADPATRDAMCVGLGSDEASKDAHDVFTHAPVSSRDATSCAEAAARIAAHDDDALDWLAKSSEPGLLRAAGESDVMSCDRLARLWAGALAIREHADYSALTIPLGAAAKRCPTTLDATLAAALSSDPESQALAVAAIDPQTTDTKNLPHACAAVKNVAHGAAAPMAKARAAEIAARCR